MISFTAIAVDRLMAVADPFRYEAAIKKTHTAIISLIVWIYTFVVTIGPSLLGYHNWAPNLECLTFLVMHKYANYSIVTQVHVAVIIIVCCYTSLFRIAVKHLKHNSGTGTEAQAKAKDVKMQRHLKVAKTLSIIIGLFCGCWLPYTYDYLYMTIHFSVDPSSFPRRLANILLPLLVLNSLINPVIYARKMPAFRREFVRILSCNKYRGAAEVSST